MIYDSTIRIKSYANLKKIGKMPNSAFLKFRIFFVEKVDQVNLTYSLS